MMKAKGEEFDSKTNDKALYLTRLINHLLTNHTENLDLPESKIDLHVNVLGKLFHTKEALKHNVSVSSRYRKKLEVMTKTLDKETREKMDEILKSLSDQAANMDILETKVDGHEHISDKLLDIEEPLKSVMSGHKDIQETFAQQTDEIDDASKKLSRDWNESEAMNEIVDKETQEKIDEILDWLSNQTANMDLLETRIDGHENIPGELLDIEEDLKDVVAEQK